MKARRFASCSGVTRKHKWMRWFMNKPGEQSNTQVLCDQCGLEIVESHCMRGEFIHQGSRRDICDIPGKFLYAVPSGNSPTAPKEPETQATQNDFLYSRNKWHMICNAMGWPAETTCAADFIDAI